MNNGALYPKQEMISHKIFNILLMLFNVLLAISFTSFLKVMRKMVVGDTPPGFYQGPVLVDFLLRKEFVIIPILLLVFMVGKEFRVKPLKKRLYINLFIFASIFAHAVFVFILPFIFDLV
jgi:hypothetical protein